MTISRKEYENYEGNSNSEEKILNFLKKNPDTAYKVKEIKEELNLKAVTISHYLPILKTKGLVESKGKLKNCFWIIKK